jgi:hypothetical protein
MAPKASKGNKAVDKAKIAQKQKVKFCNRKNFPAKSFAFTALPS